MTPSPDDLKQVIADHLPCDILEVAGDGHHFEALIVSDGFAGKSRIQRHQLVYAALGDRMRAEVHALSMRTLTPEEYRAAPR
jgi:acid stress-induced BolA-like protein IbaG/YrbA